jgi:hypothetical protein
VQIKDVIEDPNSGDGDKYLEALGRYLRERRERITFQQNKEGKV